MEECVMGGVCDGRGVWWEGVCGGRGVWWEGVCGGRECVMGGSV